MMHAYVWEDNPLGVFQMWNPNIRPVVPASDIREARTIAALQEGESNLSIENFSHQEAHIEAGETVVWTNLDGVAHTVTSGSQGVAENGFDSGNIGSGQSFVFRFDQPGENFYTCTLHPSMNAKIVVRQ
jgi:plastocyanin